MGNLSRKVAALLSGAALLAAGAALAPAAAADDYPNRTIEMIVPFTAGGTTDLTGRLTADWMEKAFGQTVTVINKPGAGGITGTTQYSKADPDGYTFIVSYVGPISINPTLYGENLPYDPATDLVPVASVAKTPMFLFVRPDLEAETLAEFIELTKQPDADLKFSSAGVGSSNHLAGEMLLNETGGKALHVAYDGSGPARNALLGGHLDFMFDSGVSLAQVEAGTLRVLAVTTDERMEQYPDIPTVAETVPGYEATSWAGIFAPGGTPKEIVDKVNAVIVEQLGNEESRAKLLDVALIPFPLSADEFQAFIEKENAKWSAAVKASGATIQ